jgi:hypothetical protein
MVDQVNNLILSCDTALGHLRGIDPAAPWVLVGGSNVMGVAKQIKRWLDDLAYDAARMEVIDSAPTPPVRLYGPGISKQQGIAMAFTYVKTVRRWAASLLPKTNPPEAGSGEQPAKAQSTEPLPPEGAKFGKDDAPAAFREGGKPGEPVLTAAYLADSSNWLLNGSYLTKHYGPGKELTTHIKVGRAKAYLYTELLVLRDRKGANEVDREEKR